MLKVREVRLGEVKPCALDDSSQGAGNCSAGLEPMPLSTSGELASLEGPQ